MRCLSARLPYLPHILSIPLPEFISQICTGLVVKFEAQRTTLFRHISLRHGPEPEIMGVTRCRNWYRSVCCRRSLTSLALRSRALPYLVTGCHTGVDAGGVRC